MNTQEFIDSGIIELYAAGGLNPAEAVEVENIAAQFPEVKNALEEALRAMEAYVLTNAQAPSPELEDRILAHIAALSAPERASEAKILPMTPSRKKGFTQQWQWAASVLLLISALANFYLLRQVREKEQELMASREKNRQYVYQTNQLEQKNFQTEELVQLLRSPQTKTVTLKAVAQGQTAAGTVIWNHETRDVFFDNRNLPSAPAGKQYQLWALLDGKPIDAGMVALDSKDLQRMKAIEEAQSFAVTLEPAGGSPSPTLSSLVVMGSI